MFAPAKGMILMFLFFARKGVGLGFSFRCFSCRRQCCQGLTLERRRIFVYEHLMFFRFFRCSWKDDFVSGTDKKKRNFIGSPESPVCFYMFRGQLGLGQLKNRDVGSPKSSVMFCGYSGLEQQQTYEFYREPRKFHVFLHFLWLFRLGSKKHWI